VVPFGRGQEFAKPIRGRKFIIVNERDEIAFGMCDRLVPGERDVLPCLDAVNNFENRPAGEFFHNLLCRLRGIIIRHNNRKCKLIAGLLTTERFQQAQQHLGTLEGANADNRYGAFPHSRKQLRMGYIALRFETP
jgi:hypothetical protein